MFEGDSTNNRKSLFGGALQLESEDLLRILPHRTPNLLLDRVVAMVPGAHGVGIKCATGNECGLATREHGFVYPATLVLESLAQLASLVMHYEELQDQPEADTRKLDILSGIEELQVERELVAGDELHLSVHLLAVGHDASREGTMAHTRFAGQAMFGGEVMLSATFTLAPFEELDKANSSYGDEKKSSSRGG